MPQGMKLPVFKYYVKDDAVKLRQLAVKHLLGASKHQNALPGTQSRPSRTPAQLQRISVRM